MSKIRSINSSHKFHARASIPRETEYIFTA